MEKMNFSQVVEILENPDRVPVYLGRWGISDPKRAHANLVQMARSGLTLDLVAILWDQLAEHLPECADPDMALTNFARFVVQARNPLSMGTLFERDSEALPTLLQIFSTSQHLSDLLISDPESFDLLRLTEGQPVRREELVDELVAEVSALEHEAAVLRTLRRFKRREILRIAYGDIVRQQSLQMVTLQLSYLADAVVEGALRAAWHKLGGRWGWPLTPQGRRARFVVLGLGKLGGNELNYSSDIDLVFLYDQEGQTDGPTPWSNREFFGRLAQEIVHALTASTELGSPYRVDLRLRPEGRHGPMAISCESAWAYYETRGRTWERQAYIKARPVAGDIDLGREFLERLQPWIYRRYLTRADITGIKALKRRIEQHSHLEGADARNVKTGHGGIRDIEFVIQFLQLLNGAELPQVRTGNTLEALQQLAAAGCLSDQERAILEENYTFLRRIEHRLQVMFDLQTHTMPEDPTELRKLALRLGYTDTAAGNALTAFQHDYQTRTELNHRILDHLLHDAFPDASATVAETDLVLDPDPPQERIEEVLGKYPFRDVQQAYRNLMALAEEKVRFLSPRRCRHFLAGIAPKLLEEIAATADPDSTLVQLGQVSDSLGGKGVLWELFSFNPPTLQLFVRLCAYSPYLAGILTSNPGMIDGLMDSLVLDKLPRRDFLRQTLSELCHGAEDLEPILHSFKNDQHLRVGVRDLLGKEDIQQTVRALTDIAETCLEQVILREWKKLVAQWGRPMVGQGRRAGQECELVVLGLGKLGGREMSYSSDLDVIFLYEAEGDTLPTPGQRERTSNQHFFSELAQRIIQTTTVSGPYGRLYEMDPRLRPTGRSGALACSLDEFVRYYREDRAELWQRQALCRARVVYGSERMESLVMEAVGQGAFDHPWHKKDALAIRQMRARIEESAPASDVKRGAGGLVDIEFLIQMLQLKHGRRDPRVRTANTLEALAALHQAGHLGDEDFGFFTRSYRFLRRLQLKVRLLSATRLTTLPDRPIELLKLAHLMGLPSSGELLVRLEEFRRQTRQRFERIFTAETG